MKKVIALALAMILTTGLSSMAFADATSDAEKLEITLDSAIYVENKNGDIKAVNPASDGTLYIAPGKTVYIPIINTDDNTMIGSSMKDAVKKVKAYADWTVNKADGNPTIEYKKIFTSDSDSEYYYVVAVKMPANSNVKAADLNGVLAVGKTKTKAMDENNNFTFNVAVGYDKDSAFGGGDVDENKPVVDFDDDATDIEINWGDDLAMFEVNVSGQSNLNLDWSTKFDADFASKYDYANIDFVKFTKNPSFNRTGTLYLYAEKDTFLYEVTADGAKAIKDAKYDESAGAWVFKTRRLGSYAISDKELKTVTSSSSSEPSSEAPSEVPGSSSTPGTSTGKPNPDTGR